MAQKLHRALLWVAALLLAAPLMAAEQHGTVTFNGLPVPGATVTATLGDQKFSTTTDQQGAYSFPQLADGTWTIRVEMLGFVTQTKDVAVAAGGPALTWELKVLPFEELLQQAGNGAAAQQVSPANQPQATSASVGSAAQPNAEVPATQSRVQGGTQPAGNKKSKGAQQAASTANGAAGGSGAGGSGGPPTSAPSAAAEAIPGSADASSQNDLSEKAAEGLLINGSALNGAASPFAQNAAFGNNRRGFGSLYTGSLGLIYDNSALDARPFSLTGLETPKPQFGKEQGVVTLGGPLRIPHLLENGPNFFVGYQWMHSRTDTAQSALVPTLDQRAGILGAPNGAGGPQGGSPAPAVLSVSPQARDLLGLYPLPNVFGNPAYNYQTGLLGTTNQNAMQSRVNKMLNQRDQLWGSFAFQTTDTNSNNLFGFLDRMDTLGLNSAANWQHRLGQRMFVHLEFQYSRSSIRTIPFFANQQNISGEDGITGNSQSAVDWGPPTLAFASGIASLTDAQYSFNRNQTAAWTYDTYLNRGAHNFRYGLDFRRQQFNYFGQQNPRGTFTFTGAATGSDLEDFLLGIPDTSSIAFGNADKYFRENVWDAYANDDWRIGPELTINAGMRWEYAAPIMELYGRLVNLDIAPGFSAAAPVLASSPTGQLTGEQYPNSLLRPDRHGFEPRVGLAWRPFPASSTVIRAGYGVYYNTSVYQSIAAQMSQQAPLSKSLTVANTAANPLTLANGFTAAPSTVQDVFAVDPNFQIGYAQDWQASIQRDLPGSLVLTGTYLGIKGTRGMQEYLPNTYPPGAANPCPSCPSGFTYLASNGNSSRESGQVQLRRRLHNGLTATLEYTYSKSTDDSALGGKGTATYVTAQNWLDLAAEEGPSAFDQRHLLSIQTQYTTGMGMGGGTLFSGWRGALLKEWTVSTAITAGSGFPLTPQYLTIVPGTGVTGPIRPDLTGASVYAAAPGYDLNSAAYTAPLPGQWGDAGRDSITGPFQFSLNASLGRTFRLKDRYSLDLRVDSTNALNHVTYTTWNTLITSAQFGLPMGTSAMRSMQTTLRLRF